MGYSHMPTREQISEITNGTDIRRINMLNTLGLCSAFATYPALFSIAVDTILPKVDPVLSANVIKLVIRPAAANPVSL